MSRRHKIARRLVPTLLLIVGGIVAGTIVSTGSHTAQGKSPQTAVERASATRVPTRARPVTRAASRPVPTRALAHLDAHSEYTQIAITAQMLAAVVSVDENYFLTPANTSEASDPASDPATDKTPIEAGKPVADEPIADVASADTPVADPPAADTPASAGDPALVGDDSGLDGDTWLGDGTDWSSDLGPGDDATSNDAPLTDAATDDANENGCSDSYDGACVDPYIGVDDVNCDDIEETDFDSLAEDPYGLDEDLDGIACESH
jgi:hypothetical protein